MAEKVQIITSEYNPIKDLIFWTLKNEAGKEQTYCWPRSDYLKSVVGLSDKTVPKVSAELLSKHCQDMIGKEINFEITGECQVAPQTDEHRVAEVENQIEALHDEAGQYIDSLIDVADEVENFRGPKRNGEST